MRATLLLICTLSIAAPADAETFRVVLGGKELGQLNYLEQIDQSTLSSKLDGTPMGVFNGTFAGTSKGTQTNSIFTGDSRSSRKKRLVTVKIAKGSVVATDIMPTNERTKLSDPSRVSGTVLDPVRAVGRLMRANGCPVAMRLYDGRRVVALTPSGAQPSGDTLVCSMSYKVVAGPGHLSPLRISSAKMRLTYGTGGGQQSLQELRISSGLFSLILDRSD